MSKRRDKPTVGFWATAVVATLLLYALSVVPMIYWSDSGYMPDPVQDAMKWFYFPLHWLIVVTTGIGNG